MLTGITAKRTRNRITKKCLICGKDIFKRKTGRRPNTCSKECFLKRLHDYNACRYDDNSEKYDRISLLRNARKNPEKYKEIADKFIDRYLWLKKQMGW
jgi:endogenous inhibitor of DNA gyrase (YacG/DUF329 family)